MATILLKTDYKDDILADSQNGRRKYKVIQNDDGTISLEDVTEYEQVGSTFGAADTNKICESVNELKQMEAAATIDDIDKIIDGTYTDDNDTSQSGGSGSGNSGTTGGGTEDGGGEPDENDVISDDEIDDIVNNAFN